jgi:hypothetical protein
VEPEGAADEAVRNIVQKKEEKKFPHYLNKSRVFSILFLKKKFMTDPDPVFLLSQRQHPDLDLNLQTLGFTTSTPGNMKTIFKNHPPSLEETQI